jgi:hypothetical protein
VVIACNSGDTLGAFPGATVATNMKRTFTAIRVCLLVGVASGAHNAADDIRPGDVVDSKLSGDIGSLVLYVQEHDEGADYGNSSSHCQFPRRRRLGALPQEVREMKTIWNVMTDGEALPKVVVSYL